MSDLADTTAGHSTRGGRAGRTLAEGSAARASESAPAVAPGQRTPSRPSVGLNRTLGERQQLRAERWALVQERAELARQKNELEIQTAWIRKQSSRLEQDRRLIAAERERVRADRLALAESARRLAEMYPVDANSRRQLSWWRRRRPGGDGR